MKYRTLLSVAILIALSASSFAQIDPLTKSLSTPKLKTDLEGTYPQHIVQYNWDEAWTPFGTVDITYQANGSPKTIQKADPSGQTLETYTYNAMGQETEMLTQVLEGGWVNLQKDMTTYEKEHYPKSYLSYEWNGTGWVLTDGMMYEYTYNGDQVDVMSVSYYHGSAWVEGMRYTYEYQSGDQKPYRIVTELNEDGVWTMGSRTTYEYDANDVSNMIIEAWTDGEWVLSAKIVNEYNINGSSEILTYSWMEGEWVSSMRMIEENDSHGNLVLSTTEFFMGEWTMLSGEQMELTYSGNNVTQRITKMYSLFEPGQETSGDLWQNFTMEVFSNFASLYVDLEDIAEPEMTVFPNPASYQINVLLKAMEPGSYKIQLMNLLGQEVYAEEIEYLQNTKVSVPLESFQNGIYFMNLSHNQELLYSEKIVIGIK